MFLKLSYERQGDYNIKFITMVFSEGEECDVQGGTEGDLQRWQSFMFCTVLWTYNNIFQYFSLSGS